MREQPKRINYSRLSLQEGSRSRMKLSEDDRLEGNGGGFFSYLAPVFDTLEEKSTFHRFLLSGYFDNCKYEVVACAVDIDISESIYAEGVTPQEQKEMLMEFKHVRQVNKSDFLLHELEGRYLWIFIGVSAAGSESHFRIERFVVDFPKSSFIKYLPEIYQNTEDTFFYRYMAALQSLYEDVESEIDRVPHDLDYELTSDENLYQLSQWVGLDQNEYPYSPKQLRYMIRNLWDFQAGKGTTKILEQVLRMITGRPIYIVEYFKWNDWMKYNTKQKELFYKLYGADESAFSVIIDMISAEQTNLPDGKTLMGQIEEYIPLGMRCNLVYLTESSRMDTHCYLDKNSVLSTPKTADTSGFMLGGNFVLG